jgi:hypothetical protein
LSTDHVRPWPKPETWNFGPLVVLVVLLGVLLLSEALGVLFAGWREFRLADDPGRVQTFTFETLLFFALFSMISIRERRDWWASMQSRTLVAALTADAAAGLAIAAFGLGELQPLPLKETVVIVLAALASSLLINDQIKKVFIARYWRAAGASMEPVTQGQ